MSKTELEIHSTDSVQLYGAFVGGDDPGCQDYCKPFKLNGVRIVDEKWLLKLVAERDKLLAALEALVMFSKPTKTNAVALNNAHQAIAAAKGGAPTIEDLQRLSNERLMTPECAARIIQAREAKGGAQ